MDQNQDASEVDKLNELLKGHLLAENQTNDLAEDVEFCLDISSFQELTTFFEAIHKIQVEEKSSLSISITVSQETVQELAKTWECCILQAQNCESDSEDTKLSTISTENREGFVVIEQVCKQSCEEALALINQKEMKNKFIFKSSDEKFVLRTIDKHDSKWIIDVYAKGETQIVAGAEDATMVKHGKHLHLRIPHRMLQAAYGIGSIVEEIEKANKYVLPIAIAVDACRLGWALRKDLKAEHGAMLKNTAETSASIGGAVGGSLAGGYAGGTAGIKIGAVVGSLLGGILVVPGAVVGGLVGSIVGSVVGGHLFGEVSKSVVSKLYSIGEKHTALEPKKIFENKTDSEKKED